MAFGAKVSLHVDTSNKASFATEIQKYVEQATKTPIQIKNIRIKIDPKALTKDINDRIRAGGGITVDVKSINAKPAIEKLRQDISKMLSGLTVGGVSAFMDGKWDEYKGSDGFKKDKKSAEDAAKATSEFNAQMKLLSSTARNVSNVAPALGDADDNEAFNNSIKESVEWLKKYYSLKNSKSPMAADEYAEFLKQGEAIHANVLKYKEQLKLEENSLQIQTKIEALKGRVQKFISANPKAYKANQYELDGILSSLDAIEANSPEAKTHLESIRLAFLSINNASREAGIMGETFFGKLKKGWEKFSNWATVSKTFMFGVRTIKTMFNSVKELDDAMVELRKVTNLTEKDYERFIEKSTAISKEVGASAADVVMASANFAKIGYSAEESSFLAEAALVYKNVGDGIEDVEEATSSIISTIKAFEHTGLAAKDAMSIVDKFNEVGNRFAIDSEGIGIALQKSASALAAAAR